MGEGEKAVLPVCNCVCIMQKCVNACLVMRLCLCMSIASCISLVSMSLMSAGGGGGGIKFLLSVAQIFFFININWKYLDFRVSTKPSHPSLHGRSPGGGRGGGGVRNKIFASCDTDLFYHQHQLEVPARRSVVFQIELNSTRVKYSD